MLQETIGKGKERFLTFKEGILNRLEDKGIDRIEAEMFNIVHSMGSEAESVELSKDERRRLADAMKLSDKEFLDVCQDIEAVLRKRLFDQVFRPYGDRIHKLRLPALLLRPVAYNNFLTKVGTFYTVCGQMTNQISKMILSHEIKEINKANAEVKEAQAEHKTYGSVIEE